MLKVRVSHLEQYRKLVAEDYGDPEEDLIADVLAWQRGEEGGRSNWQMDAGTAWHACLSGDAGHFPYGDGSGGYYASGEFAFNEADVQRALAHRGPGLHEITARRVFDTRLGPVEVKGTADHLHGLTIRDGKTRFGTPDAGAYDLSLQWRFYLELFHADCFVYDLFAMKDPDDAGLCVLRDVLSFRLWRYAALERDCLVWLNRFVDWADSHGIPGRNGAALSPARRRDSQGV